MEKLDSEKLAAYAVWLPVLNYQDAPTLQKNGQREARRLPGPRSIHYADPEGYSGKQYGKLLEISYGAPAWDIYLAYGPEVRWEQEPPPMPTYWEHQMGSMPSEKLLDGPRFADQVRKLLPAADKE